MSSCMIYLHISGNISSLPDLVTLILTKLKLRKYLSKIALLKLTADGMVERTDEYDIREP